MLKELWRYLQCLQQTEAKEEKLKQHQLILHKNAEGKASKLDFLMLGPFGVHLLTVYYIFDKD